MPAFARSSNEPAEVLRAPLVGRVFGMGHLEAYIERRLEEEANRSNHRGRRNERGGAPM
jgi:hypothetical protein